MLKENEHVYYLDDNQVYSGKVMDIEQQNHAYSFSIDSYGTCEGHYRISSEQIGLTVFLSKEDIPIK